MAPRRGMGQPRWRPVMLNVRLFPTVLRHPPAAIAVASIALVAPGGSAWSSPRHAQPPAIRVHDQDRRIDGNRINMITTNFGSFAYDLSTGNAGLVWPRGTSQTAVFASGLWLGALVDGKPRDRKSTRLNS